LDIKYVRSKENNILVAESHSIVGYAMNSS